MLPLSIPLLLLLTAPASLGAPVVETAFEEISSTTSETTVEIESPAFVTEKLLATTVDDCVDNRHPKLRKLGAPNRCGSKIHENQATTPEVEGSGINDEPRTKETFESVITRLDLVHPIRTRPAIHSTTESPPIRHPNRNPPFLGYADAPSVISTGEHWNLGSMMGRWFEAINAPLESNQRCTVRLYEGLKKNGSSFSIRKMYRGEAEDTPSFASLFNLLSKNKTKEEPIANSIDFVTAAIHPEKGLLLIKSTQDLFSEPELYYKHGPEVENDNDEMQYEYVIMSPRAKYPVTVLARDLDVFKEKYEKEAFQWLVDNGFSSEYKRAFNMIKSVSYSTCEYTEETYEMYGM